MYLFIGCKKDKAPDQPCTPTNFTGMLPLHIGNEWIYRTTIYDTSGAISNQTYDTLQINGDTVIDCDTKYILKRTYNFYDGVFLSNLNGILTLTNTKDGFNTSFDGVYPYPIISGNKTVKAIGWRCTSYNKYYSYNSLAYYDSLINQSFFCNSYSLDSTDQCGEGFFLTSYYCHGIGLIVQKYYESWFYHNNNVQYPDRLYSTMELMSYTLH